MKVSINELKKIFSLAFGQEVDLVPETKRDDIELWDSINHLNLIVELEDSLKISFTKEEIEKISSLSQLIEIISKK